MIDFAVIGSNGITENFVNGTLINNDLRLTAVYSHTLKTAQNVADKFNVRHCFDNLQALGQCDDIDAVYIVSPNYLHFEHALLMLKKGKHVICEKPLASNIQQVEAHDQAATAKNVIFLKSLKQLICQILHK
jgi:predicted dehydrogenase